MIIFEPYANRNPSGRQSDCPTDPRLMGTMTQTDRIQRAYCTTREAAQMLGVSLRTAQLWSESGLLEAWKTDGGHRRIARQSVERLLANPAIDAPPRPAPPGRTPFSILVVEDETALCRIYELTLARWPMRPQVQTAHDGYAALIRIGLARPDLLVTDLRMPGMDGFRMLRSVRAQPELAGMGIVVVTGLAPGEIEDQGGIPPGIPVLPKPVPFDQLHEIARAIAASREAAIPAGR